MEGLFRTVPLFWAFSITTLLVFLCIWAGYRFAVFRRKMGVEDETPINTIVGALLGLLAFILAFTFDATTSRFDTRKQLLLDEVNAIETTYLRAGLIPQPYRSNVRKTLKAYVQLRIDIVNDPAHAVVYIQKSASLQDTLWKNAEALADADLKNADISSLFVDALNTMIDLQTSRLTVSMIHRLPFPMWATLYALTMLAMMGVGYLFGMTGNTNWGMSFVLAFSFAAIMTLIIDLDRSGGAGYGYIKVNQQPMIDLHKRLNQKVD
jgi:hypothetical protein